MISEPLTETLPPVRCTLSLKMRLRRIAVASIARDTGAHIRAAVERYVEQEERRLGFAPLEEPPTVEGAE